MKPALLFLFMYILFPGEITAQTEKKMESSEGLDIPYSKIPDAPDFYSAGNIAARVIDGLGFRYFWATEGLREVDLQFKPSDEARTTAETLDHIYGLSRVILNATLQQANDPANAAGELNFEDKRGKTLENFKKASDKLKASGDVALEEYKVVFKRGENFSEFPFWNLLNGPIADALWHTGQVASFRRSSGNPINPKISVFTGSVRE